MNTTHVVLEGVGLTLWVRRGRNGLCMEVDTEP